MVFGEGLPTSYFTSLTSSTDNTHALLTIGYGWSWSQVYGGLLGRPETWNKVYGDKFIAYPIDYVADGYLVASFEGDGNGKILYVEKGKVRKIVGEKKYPLTSAISLKE